MGSKLWDSFYNNDIDQFRKLVATATATALSSGNGPRGRKSGGISSSPSASSSLLAGGSPRLVKSRKSLGSSKHNRHDAGGAIEITLAELNWRDGQGLSLLHHIVSDTSRNRAEYAAVLLECPGVDIYAQDEENGWTAFHRALFFGNITIARYLLDRDSHEVIHHLSLGTTRPARGLIKIKDRESFSAFDLFEATVSGRKLEHVWNLPLIGHDSGQGIEERAQGIYGDEEETNKTNLVCPRYLIDGDEAFAFGSNKNLTLGLGDEDDRQYPERVTLRRSDHLVEHLLSEYRSLSGKAGSNSSGPASSKPFGLFELPAVVRYHPTTILDMKMSKLHSAMLTTDPQANLHTCGFGSGGRLGHGDEMTHFEYSPVIGGGFQYKRIVNVALGLNHTIAITDHGETFTWGTNAFGQLGYATGATTTGPASEKTFQLFPRQVYGPLKRELIVSAAASGIHSVVHTPSSLFTFGKNEGQMGLVDSDARTLLSQNVPRKVGASLFACALQSVAAIDKATVCLLESHEVWVFANYGYSKLSFTVESPFRSLNTHINRKADSAAAQTKVNKICKIEAGGETVGAMTENGDVFTLQVESKSADTSATTSTTNPAKIKGALTRPQRVWSTRHCQMAVKDFDIGQDGSIIICTKSGSVWRRIKRPKIKDASSAGFSEYRSKDYKFSRVPTLTKIVAVRSNVFGAYAAIRRDCEVLKTELTAEGTSFWRDLYPLLSFHEFGAEDSDTEEPQPRFWRSSQSVDTAALRRAILASKDIETDLSTLFHGFDTAHRQTYDLHLGSTTSDVRIPAHAFMLSARSPTAAQGLSDLHNKYHASIPDVASFEYDKNGQALILFQDLDFISLLNLVLYIYTDTVVDVWHYTRRDSSLAFRYRQIRSELLKTATSLKMKGLEHAVRIMTEPEKIMTHDFERAMASSGFSDKGEIRILLAEAKTQMVHRIFVCQRCPFFEGMLQGRSSGKWLSDRTGHDDKDQSATIDLSHIKADVFQFVLRHVYVDADETMFDDVVSADLESYLDLIIDVLAAANELLLDRLAQCCQKALGKYVNTRNVCQLLNVIAPCSITTFKDAALEYICLNLEGMLENGLLNELDDELMPELDAVIKENQANYLPISKKLSVDPEEENDNDEEKNLALIEGRVRAQRIRADQAGLASRLHGHDMRQNTLPRPRSDFLEDFEHPGSPKIAQSPSLTPVDELRSPVMAPRHVSNDFMFEMEEASDSRSPHGKELLDEATKPTTQNTATSLDRVDKDHKTHSPILWPCDDRRQGLHITSSDWPSPSSFEITPKFNMKDVLNSSNRAQPSSLSSALASARSPAPSPPPQKISQKERKKQQQKARLDQSSSMIPTITETSTPSSPPTSPWQRPSAVTSVSLKEVLQPETPGSAKVKATQTPRTPSSMTLRQTIAGKQPSSSNIKAGPSTSISSKPKAIPPPRSISIYTSHLPNSQSPSTPVNSILPTRTLPSSPKTNTIPPPPSPIIKSIQHQPPLRSQSAAAIAAETGLQLSMDEILAQQQIEKDVLRDVVGKRSLVEIQEEQAFQEWWTRETRKVQGIGDDGPRPSKDTGDGATKKKKIQKRKIPQRTSGNAKVDGTSSGAAAIKADARKAPSNATSSRS